MFDDQMHSKSPFAVAGLSSEFVHSVDADTAVKVAKDLLRAQLLELHPDKIGDHQSEDISDQQSALSTALEDLDVSAGLAEALRKSYLAENPFDDQINEARQQVAKAVKKGERFSELFIDVLEAMAASPAPHYLQPVARKFRLVDPVAMFKARKKSDTSEDQKLTEDAAASIDRLADKLLGRNKPVQRKYYLQAYDDLRDHGPESLAVYVNNRISKEEPELDDRIASGKHSKADERKYNQLLKKYQADFEKTTIGKRFLDRVLEKARELQERALADKFATSSEEQNFKLNKKAESGPLSPENHSEYVSSFRKKFAKEQGFTLIMAPSGALSLANKNKKIPGLNETKLVGYIAYAVSGGVKNAADYSPHDFASEVFFDETFAIPETIVDISKFGETELTSFLRRCTNLVDSGSPEFGISIKNPKSTTADHLVMLVGLVSPKNSAPYLTVLGAIEAVDEVKSQVKSKSKRR